MGTEPKVYLPEEVGVEATNLTMFWVYVLAALTAIASSDAFMPGGATTMTTKQIKDDETLQRILPQVEMEFNARSNSLHAYRSTNMVQIKKRVVAGLEYEITLQFTPTKCKKNVDKDMKQDLKDCKLSVDNGRPQTCTFVAWYRPWLILGQPQPVRIISKGHVINKNILLTS